MDRFQHIIRWSVFGHVHHESYDIAHGVRTKNPIGVNYWAGSVSTNTLINPSFKLYEVDMNTMLPVKAHTYILDIANTKD